MQKNDPTYYVKPFFYLSAATAFLLASCSGNNSTATHHIITEPVPEIKTGIPSEIQSGIDKTDRFIGIAGHHMIRQTLLKKTRKGLKIVPEYNYTAPALDGKEYTRLYCIMDVNGDDSDPLKSKNEIQDSFKTMKLPFSPIFLTEEEYTRLSPQKRHNALAWKYREQIAVNRRSSLITNKYMFLLDAASGITLGRGDLNFFFAPCLFLDFMISEKEPDPNYPGHIIYQMDKTDIRDGRKCHSGLINLPYTNRLFFLGLTYYSFSDEAKAKIIILPPRNNSQHTR